MEPFSIIIPTWKNLKYLNLAYESIRKNSAVKHEIIIFFNEITEECIKWASEKPDIKYLGAEKNLGVCKAINSAAAIATCNYILFLNDDMYALPCWDMGFYPFLNSSEIIWLSGTAIERGKAADCYIGGQDYGSSPDNFEEERLLKEYKKFIRPYNVISTWTPILISKYDWNLIGGFDERYFPGYGSDPDLAMKMFNHGCRKFIGVGTSLFYHFSRTTIQRFDHTDAEEKAKKFFKEKWKISWRKFIKKMIYRGKIITPSLLIEIEKHGIEWENYKNKLARKGIKIGL